MYVNVCVCVRMYVVLTLFEAQRSFVWPAKVASFARIEIFWERAKSNIAGV